MAHVSAITPKIVKTCLECGGKGRFTTYAEVEVPFHDKLLKWTSLPVVSLCIFCKGKGRLVTGESEQVDILYG